MILHWNALAKTKKWWGRGIMWEIANSWKPTGVFRASKSRRSTWSTTSSSRGRTCRSRILSSSVTTCRTIRCSGTSSRPTSARCSSKGNRSCTSCLRSALASSRFALSSGGQGKLKIPIGIFNFTIENF